MNLSLPPQLNVVLTAQAAQTYFYVALTILIAVIVDSILRSLIKIPKHFENRRARTYATILRNIITVIVYAIALHVVFIELGINITPLLASAGILSVIIGISARAFIEDFISGFFILSQSSIAVGDYVKIEDAEGYIDSINLRTLTIRSETGAMYIFPNGLVKKVINYSRQRARILIDIPIKNNQQIDPAVKAAEQALEQLEASPDMAGALIAGSLVEGVDDFKPVGPIILRVSLHTYPAMRWKVGRKYRYLVKKALEKNKVLLG